MANGLFGGGNGTVVSPFLIEDLLDLNAIRNYGGQTKYFKVVNDIDASLESLEAVGLGNDGNGWKSVGSSDLKFESVLDFNKKAIKNLFQKSESGIGFIDYLGKSGQIKNFIFLNFKFSALKLGYFNAIICSQSLGSITNGVIKSSSVVFKKGAASLAVGFARRTSVLRNITIENCSIIAEELSSTVWGDPISSANFTIAGSELGGSAGFMPVIEKIFILNSFAKADVCSSIGVEADCRLASNPYGSIMYIEYKSNECLIWEAWTPRVKDIFVSGNTMEFVKYCYKNSEGNMYDVYDDAGVAGRRFFYGNTYKGPSIRKDLYVNTELNETQVRTASIFGDLFIGSDIKIEDGSIPRYYIDTSPTFPAEVKTATGKDGSTNDPEVFNTAIAYALDFNNWWVIEDGVSQPYKPNYYVKEVGSIFPLESKLATGKDGEDIIQTSSLLESSYQLDFNNWWDTIGNSSQPIKPNYYVRENGSIFPAFINSLTSKDGLSITEEESEKKSTYAFDWNNTPFVIEDGLKSPDMNYFDGSIIIEIPSGKYSKSIATGIKCSVFEKVLYTTDGTEPNSESNMVDSGFKVNISESCTLKARAYSKVFIGGSYQEFMGDIVSETYYISFKSVYDRITSRLKFEESYPVEAYFDKDVDGNLFVMLAKNSDDVMSVQRNGDEISEYFSDASMKDYDFSTEEENVYTMYDEFGNFICSVKPSKITSIDDNSDDILSEVSDTFLDLYSSFEDISVIKKYVKGYRDVYEFINSVVKLKKIKECIDEDLSVIDEIGEVASSLKSRKNKLREINSVDLNILEIERIEEPSIEINTTYKDLMMGVDLKNG